MASHMMISTRWQKELYFCRVRQRRVQQECLTNMTIDVLLWIAKSLDIYAIENVWSVKSRCINGMNRPWHAAERNGWQNITEARIQRLVVSAPCRLGAIVETRVNYFWVFEWELSLYVCEICIALGAFYSWTDPFKKNFTEGSFSTNKFIQNNFTRTNDNFVLNILGQWLLAIIK